jgi:Family of unknown function (DUF6463)
MIDILPKRGRWLGRYIIAVSGIHTLFGIIFFFEVGSRILADGVFNAVGQDPMRGAVAWFMLAGFFMTALGLAIDLLESFSPHANFSALGWVLLIICGVGIILMPQSGFWLLLVPAIAMVAKRQVGMREGATV